MNIIELVGVTEVVFTTAISAVLFGLWRMLAAMSKTLKHEHMMSKRDLEACIEPIRDSIAGLKVEVQANNTELAHIKGQLEVITIRGGR